MGIKGCFVNTLLSKLDLNVTAEEYVLRLKNKRISQAGCDNRFVSIALLANELGGVSLTDVAVAKTELNLYIPKLAKKI